MKDQQFLTTSTTIVRTMYIVQGTAPLFGLA